VISRWRYSSANGGAIVVGIARIGDIKMMEEKLRILDIESEENRVCPVRKDIRL